GELRYQPDRQAGQRKRAPQATPEVDSDEDVLRPGIDLAHRFAEPAVDGDLVGLARVPDIHGAEVRVVGVRVSNAGHDGHLAFIPERLDGAHGWMESEAVVDGQDFLLGNAYGAAIVIVEPITVRDDGIERVVPAGQLQNDECRLLLNCGHEVPILPATPAGTRVSRRSSTASRPRAGPLPYHPARASDCRPCWRSPPVPCASPRGSAAVPSGGHTRRRALRVSARPWRAADR